jgi:hypothetical protein
MSIIIPAGIDEESVRVPMQFPLRADADTVLDYNGRVVLTIDESISPAEAHKFAKLFALAPDMFQLLGESYITLKLVAANTDGYEDKEGSLINRLENAIAKLA